MRYHVVDQQTQATVKTYVSKLKARLEADRLDYEYGGYRYYVKAVEWKGIAKREVLIGAKDESNQ